MGHERSCPLLMRITPLLTSCHNGVFSNAVAVEQGVVDQSFDTFRGERFTSPVELVPPELGLADGADGYLHRLFGETQRLRNPADLDL